MRVSVSRWASSIRLSIFSSARRRSKPDDNLTQYNVACAHAVLGEAYKAIDLLEHLLPHANHETKAWVNYDSDFDGIRAHPRFQKVLELIG